MKRLCAKLGLNYLYGLANFTLGAILGGIVVAGKLLASGHFH